MNSPASSPTTAPDQPRVEAPVQTAHARFAAGDADGAVRWLREHDDDPSCRALLVEYLAAERDVAGLAGVFARPATDPIQRLIESAIQAHLRGDPAEAARRGQEALRHDPGNPRAQNHIGRALFNLGRREEALAAFRAAVANDPGYVQAINNIGHVERALGRPEAALAQFRAAAHASPGFVEARFNLGVMLLAQPSAEAALGEFEAVLALRPGHPDALVNAGSCLHLLRRYEEAETRYRAVIDRPGPPLALAWRQLAKLYIETARIDRAIETFRALVARLPDVAEFRAELVSTLEVANRLDEAEHEVRAALARHPDDAVLQYEAAKIERRRGAAGPALQRLLSIPRARIPPHLQQWFHFELGTALDANGRYDEAFAAFVESNRHAGHGMRARMVDRGALDRILDALQHWVAQGAPAPTPGPDEDLGEDLVFLLGFPRSGTTLLDLMLDGHAQVQSLEERQTMEPVFWLVDQRFGGFPHGLAGTSAGDRAELRAHYRQRLVDEGVVPQRGGIVVDKMPMRSPYVAFIQRLFPRARFLFALRHPLDVVLSNFMQNYAANDVFVHFHQLEEIARVYARVMRIWQATQRCIPTASWMPVRYEDLVADRDAVLRPLCRFLGIEWQAEMGDHLRTLAQRQHIKTNSYQQVTQPVYRRSAGRWRHYERHLNPVRPLLEPYLQAFGYAESSTGPA